MIPNIEFKEAMSLIPTSVGVVWLNSNNNQKIGCTISSFISVSVTTDSEVIAFVLKGDSRTAKFLIEAGSFQVAILNQRQLEIARIFSSSLPVDQLNEALLGYPSWVENAVCWFKLSVRKTFPFNDTVMFIADVNEYRYNVDSEPLIYSSRRYSGVTTLG